MFLVSLLKFKARGKFTVMCNAVLIGERDVLAACSCALEIAISGNLDKYVVRVAEGLDDFYMCTLKHILCVDYDVNYVYGVGSQLAWIVVSISI